MRPRLARSLAALVLVLYTAPVDAVAQPARLSLAQMVAPSARFLKDGQAVKFALHGFIEFECLEDLFLYIDSQAGRWTFSSTADRQTFADGLLHRGVESRLVSMVYEPPLELLLTYTPRELAAAIAGIRTPDAPLIFKGTHWHLTPDTYRAVLLQIQTRWTSSLNCWSAAPSIPARVLSNWYLIAEGIELFGASYDSTEHFWQAVKYHPSVRAADLIQLLEQLDRVDWAEWLRPIERDQSVYLAHTYAIEFLRANLAKNRRDWFRSELQKYSQEAHVPVRELQQRDRSRPGRIRFTALEEKILWGDLADLLHLIHVFSTLEAGRFQTAHVKPIVAALVAHHFDGIYVSTSAGPPIGFISPEFRRLMLEIWKVKFLKMERFGEVIRSTRGVKLDHFLNDGDSPDIPIPIYVGYLNEIRDLAIEQGGRP